MLTILDANELTLSSIYAPPGTDIDVILYELVTCTEEVWEDHDRANCSCESPRACSRSQSTTARNTTSRYAAYAACSDEADRKRIVIRMYLCQNHRLCRVKRLYAPLGLQELSTRDISTGLDNLEWLDGFLGDGLRRQRDGRAEVIEARSWLD